MKFHNKADATERRLLKKGYRLERGRRITRVYTGTGFGRFSRKQIDEVLKIADCCRSKVSASQPFLIHIRELKGISHIKGVKSMGRG